MAILTLSGRAAVAALIKAGPLYLAWGTGSAAWDTTPVAPVASDSALVAELGRRLVETISFCTADAAGAIVFPDGAKYSATGTPTGYLYIRVTFDYADAPTGTIRETALYQGTVPAPGHGADKYLAVANVQAAGLLMTLDRIPKIARSSSNREIFEFVLTI
jgi:hypothetical protein